MSRFIIILMLFLAAPGFVHAGGRDLLWSGAVSHDPSLQIVAISADFLGRKYQADTLGGGPEQPEVLTVNLDAVDCFTFLDYVEAARRSAAPEQFRDRLKEVRYHAAHVSWQSRKHFFTDWSEEGLIDDVTASVGGNAVVTVDKVLNRKSDGTLYLQAVATRPVSLDYIPTQALNSEVLSKLQAGDYLGIYSDQDGLDVSHVGILIRHDGGLSLRHVSSRPEIRKVIDSPLLEYLHGKPGIVVLRARPL